MQKKHMGAFGLSFAILCFFSFLPLSFAFAQTSPSLSVTSLSPGSSVTPGNEISFTVVPTGFSNPSFTVSDSFSGSSVTSADINSSGVFTWIPTQADSGTHTIQIYATDGSGDNASVTEQITVQGTPSLSVSSLSPGTTLSADSSLSFDAAASNFSGTPYYSVSDSFSGSSVTTGDINSSTGAFNWTPEAQDAGTHVLTVYATDSQGDSANTTETITVNQTAGITASALSPGSNVTAGEALTFTVTAVGFSNPTFSLGDTDSESSISNSDINSSGVFTWTPTNADVGSHTISVFASDSSGHSASLTEQVTVGGAGLTVSTLSPGNVVTAGTPVSFTVSAPGFTSPVYSVADSFSGANGTVSSVSVSDINDTTGTFTWTPGAEDVGVHTIDITGSDSYGHTGSANVSIIVNPAQSVTTTPTTTTTTTTPTTTTSSTEFDEYLGVGSTGAEVTALQNILIQEGYLSVAATGYYGSLTEAAVEEFQGAHDIAQVGFVGPETRAALNAVGTSSSSSLSTSSSTSTSAGDGYVFSNYLGVGSTGTDVTELQDRLTALGVYSGPVTGYYGSLTQAAVEVFQGDHGIEQVGFVGPETRAALNAQ